MHNFFIKLLQITIDVNNWFFAPVDGLIEKMQFTPWLADALKDSIHMLPFLFFIFLVIEFVEFFYSKKLDNIVRGSKNAGPLVGSLVASVPQCGFSVIASTLYTRKLITRGTLLAVYLSTSDEAIPILLTDPSKFHVILQIIAVKITIGVIAGYLTDLLTERSFSAKSQPDEETDTGCCHHDLSEPKKRDLIMHPILHTLNVFFFILLVTIAINFGVHKAGGEENLGAYFLNNSIFQPIITAIFGLIPNCAVSIAITLMYIKGAIGFGSAIAGLCSGAGLGILVLFKKNGDLKDTLRIIGLLLIISMVSGILIQTFYN